MRLEHLCDFSLSYDEAGLTLVRPFAGHEAQGFGSGSGRAAGRRLSGPIRWSNFPRMADDGVLMPNVRGVISTATGAVLFGFRGYSLVPPAGDSRRAVVASVFFRTDSDEHRWLNHTVAVHEGAIDFADMTSHFPAYVCLPEPAATLEDRARDHDNT